MFIICGNRREQWGPCVYVSKSGFVTSQAVRAHEYGTKEEARADLGYYQREYQGYAWVIERIPSGVSAERGATFAVAVE